ncbi:hypothetical protein GOB93_14350 [Acetobacter musti]|uniref:Uncharacterized protein n=1 Tax=Acetobacter musti TaxID=864732 RepID=A0ABX0JRJ6_9PROT|nr:hypothetical protein [Acetobacter musti]NHN85814.1 hypothetical protein [Acetobacter musti]
MKKLFCATILALSFLPATAYSQQSRTWIQGQVLTSAQMNAFDAAKVNTTNGTLTNPTINGTSLSSRPVQWTDIGSSIPGLDSNGNVTAPVNTAGSITALTQAYFGTTPLDYGLAQTNTSWRPGAAFFTSFGDSAASPRAIHLGGLGSHNDAYVNLIGMLMGHSDNSGAVLSIQDTDGEFGANRIGAGGTDGIVEFTKTSNVAPRLEAGADITNADGVVRTVTVDTADFKVTPAFTPAQLALIQGNGIIRVYLNWKNGNNTASTPHGFSIPNVYYGYMDATKVTTTTDATTGVVSDVFPVMVDDDSQGPGWRTQNSITAAAAAPGTNTGDTIDTTTDTTSSAPGLVWHYADTAVFIGMSDGKTIHNDMAQYTPGNDSITRAMTGVEYDLLADQTADYQYKVDGVMINVDGNGHELTDDSIEMYLGGGIKHHLQIGDAFCGQYGIETSGFSLNGQCPLTTANSGVNIAKFQGETGNGHHEAMVFSMSSGADPNNLTNYSMALTGGIDPNDTSTTTAWGTALGALKWNSDGDMQSLALCGGQFGQYCNLVASGDGTVKLKGATVVSAQMSLTPGMDLIFQSATSTTDAYLYGAGNGVIGIGTGISGGGGLTMPGLLNVGGAATLGSLTVTGGSTFSGQIAIANNATWTGNLIAEAGSQLMFQNATSTTAAYVSVDALGNLLENTGMSTGGGFGVTPRTYSQLATAGLTLGTQSYCSDCYDSAGDADAVAGAPVWWNGSTWVTADGSPAQTTPGTVAAAVTPASTITASGATTIPIPTTGSIVYVVNATADATLQFSGSAASGQSQEITLIIPATSYTVTLPSTGVIYAGGSAPTVSTVSGQQTLVNYRATSGVTAIAGGI